MLSSNPRETEYVRKALLGNSFSCPVVAWLLSHLLFDNKLITRKPSLTELSLGVPWESLSGLQQLLPSPQCCQLRLLQCWQVWPSWPGRRKPWTRGSQASATIEAQM